MSVDANKFANWLRRSIGVVRISHFHLCAMRTFYQHRETLRRLAD